MIKNLFPAFKNFDKTAGMNRNKSDISLKSETSELIHDILETCVEIDDLIKKADALKRDYKMTSDQSTEDSLAHDLNELNGNINRLFSQCNGDVDKIRKEVTNEKKYDPTCMDPKLRMKDLLSKSLQGKVFNLIKKSQKNQLEIRITIEDKIARQLSIYDPTLKKDDIQKLIKNPNEVQKIVRERMFQGTNKRIQKAIDKIKEKLVEIDELESNVNYLCQMIDDLSLIIKAQTELVNSIEENMKGVKEFIVLMIENFEKAKKGYMTAQQKFCCIFLVMVIVMIFGINYAMGKIGII